jgi:cytochrome c oxidase subunit II
MLVYFGIVMLAVIALWLHAMRRDPGELSAAESTRQGRRWTIYGGLLLPTASIAALLAIGIPVGQRMLAWPDDDALRIHVTAHQWWWKVEYPDHGIELGNTLHIPIATPIDVHLISTDVIHSFWVPRLAGKLDALPGRTNVLRLQADRPGRYLGQCAEFCGIGHAHMRFEVIAHSKEDFSRWLGEAQVDD